MTERPSVIGGQVLVFDVLATVKAEVEPSATYDLVGRSGLARPWVGYLLLTFLCSASAIVGRVAIDDFLPGASPFILIYPAITVATLLGTWQAGCLTLAILFVYAWYIVMPLEYSFLFADTKAEDWLVLALVTGILTVVMAEFIRLTYRRRVEERKEKIELQQLLLREVNHRVRNNFAIITSLLSLQERSAADQCTREALATAIARIQALEQANDNIYASSKDLVDLRSYLGELCDKIAKAIFPPADVTVTCECSPVKLQRDRAVAIGLITNELLTNAAKHAFKGLDRGHIAVQLDDRNAKLTFSVSDDGVGFSKAGRQGALGKRLIQALCAQAGGTPAWHSNSTGTTFVLDLQPPGGDHGAR